MVEALHHANLTRWFHPNHVMKKAIQAVFILLLTLLVWNLPASAFGIEGLTVVQQRIMAIFVYAALMWVFEVVPAWATSISIMVLLLIFTLTLSWRRC